MYEKLTQYIESIPGDEHGSWTDNSGHAGTKEDPIPFAHVRYSELTCRLKKDLFAFVEEHREMELTNYGDILRRNGIRRLTGCDAGGMDGQCVMALLVAVFRSERFGEGQVLECLENGDIVRWLGRLKELDEDER